MRLRVGIFVSYARADRERVRPLVEELRRRGYRVFFDVEPICWSEQPGTQSTFTLSIRGWRACASRCCRG